MQSVQAGGALQGAKGILEIQTGHNVIRVVREPGPDGESHGQAPLGGSDPKLSAFEEGFQIRPGLGKEQVTDKFGPEHADENGSDPPTALIKTNKFVIVGQTLSPKKGVEVDGQAM